MATPRQIEANRRNAQQVRAVQFVGAARRAGRGILLSPSLLPQENQMTVSVVPALCPTAFDKAFASAVAAGWPGFAAFHACLCMRGHGMSDVEIERLFIDCAKRVQ